jgi:hypothetical protein
LINAVDLFFYVLPILAGVVAGKYVGRFANFWIMLAVFQIDVIILLSGNTGMWSPRMFIPVIFWWPPLSRGQYIPPLVFIAAAIVIYNVRYLPRR